MKKIFSRRLTAFCSLLFIAVSCLLLAVSLLGCGTLNTPSPSNANYKDVFNGFSIYQPSGWSVQTSAGNILVAKDSAGLTGAIVYPSKLKTAGSKTAKEYMNLYFDAISNVTSGTSTTALTWTSSSETDSNSASGSYSGKINGTDVNGEIYCSRNSDEIICKLYWGPTDTFSGDKGTLQSIVSSYSKLSCSEIASFVNKQKDYSTQGVGSASFRVSYPSGWNVQGTGRGIDLISSDSSEVVSLATVYPATSTTASGFVSVTITSLQQRGYSNFSTIWEKDNYPSNITDPQGNTWKFYSRQCSFKDPYGKSCTGIFYSGVATWYGIATTSCMMTFISAWSDKWDSVKDKLTAMESRIQVLKFDDATSNIKYPQSQPADSSSAMDSWEYKNRVDDRLSATRSEAILGYQRTEDTLGEYHDMPLNSYDSTIGGYRDPYQPNTPMTIVNE